MQHYLDAFRHYADFSGRATRSDYWFFFLFNMIVAFLIAFLEGLTVLADPPSEFGPIYGIYVLGVIVPCLALATRRLHDIGKSGWMLFVVLIPLVGNILWLVWFCRDSADGDNEYGPSPKAGA